MEFGSCISAYRKRIVLFKDLYDQKFQLHKAVKRLGSTIIQKVVKSSNMNDAMENGDENGEVDSPD